MKSFQQCIPVSSLLRFSGAIQFALDYAPSLPQAICPSIIVVFTVTSNNSFSGTVNRSSSHTTASKRFPIVNEPVSSENEA